MQEEKVTLKTADMKIRLSHFGGFYSVTLIIDGQPFVVHKGPWAEVAHHEYQKLKRACK